MFLKQTASKGAAATLFVVALALLSGCAYQGGSGPQPTSAPVRGELRPHVVATFSIVAADPKTGELGVAVQSKFFGVGSVVPWAKAGVGAIATQSYANTTYGPKGLELLAKGKSASEVVQLLTQEDSGRDNRQLGIVDAKGLAASYTGSKCNAWAGHKVGTNFCVQGNILTGADVVEGMATAFEAARASGKGELCDWMLAALEAAQKAGGDSRGKQSAAMLVVREKGGYAGMNDRFIDLHVEDNPEPITELGRLLELHKKFYEGAHTKKSGSRSN